MARTDARSSAIMAAGTLVSRILGFVKTILLTVAIGSLSTVGDVFETANTLPNLIYVLVAGGVFNAVLVPQIIKAAKAQDGGARYISKLVTLTVTAIGLVTLITVACAWPIISVMGSGWTPRTTAARLHLLPLVSTPDLLLWPLHRHRAGTQREGRLRRVHVVAGAEQRHHHPVAIPLHLPLRSTNPNPHPLHTVDTWTSAQTLVLAGSSTLGVVMQALVLFIPLRKLGLRLKPDFAWRGIGLREASKLAAWTLASGIISNLAFLYMTKVAAGIVGQREHYAAMGIQIPGLQALNYASMLYMLPHGVIGISIATVLFNRMSASAIADDSDSVIYALSTVCVTPPLPPSSAWSDSSCWPAPSQYSSAAATPLRPPSSPASSSSPRSAPHAHHQLPLQPRALRPRRRTHPFRIQVYSAIIMVVMSFAASMLDAQYTVYMLAWIYPIHNILLMFISHYMVRRRLGYYGQRGIVSVYARTILASLFAGAIAAIALWLLGGYQLDGFAWSSKITSIITLVVCGSVMGLAYLAGVQIFRVKEANALLAPITSKLERLARR